MDINKDDLLKLMEYNFGRQKKVELDIDIKDYPDVETIKVPFRNIPKKKEYIDKTYNEDLEHKNAEDVKIIGIQL